MLMLYRLHKENYNSQSVENLTQTLYRELRDIISYNIRMKLYDHILV